MTDIQQMAAVALVVTALAAWVGYSIGTHRQFEKDKEMIELAIGTNKSSIAAMKQASETLEHARGEIVRIRAACSR